MQDQNENPRINERDLQKVKMSGVPQSSKGDGLQSVSSTPSSSSNVLPNGSSTISLGFSKDEEASVVPFTPDQGSSNGAQKGANGTFLVPMLPEDPLEDFKRSREAHKKKYFEQGSSVENEKSICEKEQRSRDGINQHVSEQSGSGSAKINSRKNNAILQVIKPMGILVPKNNTSSNTHPEVLKVWTGNSAKPLNVFGANFKLNLQPVNVAERENEAVVPDSVETSAETDDDRQTLLCADDRQTDKCKGQAESGKRLSGDGKCDRSKGQSSIDGVRYYCFSNLNKNLIVKAKKFQLNGEDCFLIPAKVALKQSIRKGQSSQQVKGQSMKFQLIEKASNEAHEGTSSYNARNGMEEGNKCALVTESQVDKKSKAQPNNESAEKTSRIRINSIIGNPGREASFSILSGRSLPTKARPAVKQKGYIWYSDETVMQPIPESQPNFPTLEANYPAISSINTLKESQKKQYCMRFQKSQNVERAKMRISNLDKKCEMSKGKGDAGELTGQNNIGSSDAHELIKGRPILQYVITHSKSGTLIFADGKCSRELDFTEPPLTISDRNAETKRQSTRDQIVPDLTGTINASRNRQPYLCNEISTKDRRTKSTCEIAALINEIKDQIGVSEHIDETGLIIMASNYIMSMEIRIRGILTEIGFNLHGSNAAAILTDAMNSLDEDISSTGYQQTNSEGTNEFLVAQIRNSQSNSNQTNAGKLPEVPNLDRSTSPELQVTNDAAWSAADEQSHFSQERSKNVFSSQLSFNDSEASENLQEFDLFFEKESCQNEDVGKTFQAYVNDVLSNFEIGDLESCGKVSPHKATQHLGADISTPEQILFSTPRDNFCLSGQSSPVIKTPQTFSVNSLDYDFDSESSPKWYQTLDHEIGSPDLVRFQTGNLSMKVVKEKMNPKKSDKKDEVNLYIDDFVAWSNRSEEDKMAAELLSQLCEGDRRKEIKETFDDVMIEKEPAKEEDEDTEALKYLKSIAPSGDSSLENPKVILAKDLMKSDLLASFLYPKPTCIPEDPFGIGAETTIERSFEVVATKEDITTKERKRANVTCKDITCEGPSEITPPQTCLETTQQPLKFPRRTRKQKASFSDEGVARKRPNRRRNIEIRQDSPLSSNAQQNDSVFIPEIKTERKQQGSTHRRKKRAPVCGRKEVLKKENPISICGKSKGDIIKTKTRKARQSFQRRKALKLIN